MSHWVVITGASNGIGYELALQWAQANHQVIAIARSKEKLEELRRACPDRIHAIPFDLSHFDAYEELVSKVRGITESVDVLINNAGLLINKPYEEMTVEDFDSIIDVNYKAPYFLTQQLLPLISNSGKRAIINIGSVGGVDNTDKFPGLSIYSSSKGAISTLTECLAKEIEAKDCTINCLALGAVETDMLKKAFPGYIPDIKPQKMAKLIMSFILSNDHIISGKVIQMAGISV